MSDTPRTNFVAHESRDPEWNRSVNRFGRMKSHAEILERELATAQEELKQMRILAANPHSIQSVKDHLGPLSMWSQSGLEEHDRQILQAANAEIAALRKDYNELIMAATQMVSVPRIKAGSQDGWLVEFAWLKKVKTALRSMPDWEDCSIDLEEIEAVALAMLAAQGDRNG